MPSRSRPQLLHAASHLLPCLQDNVVLGDNVTASHALLCAGATMHSGAVLQPGVVLSYNVVIGRGHTVPGLSIITLCKQLQGQVRSRSTHAVIAADRQ